MAYILCIETSTRICSVALHNNGELVAIRENNSLQSHGANITLFVNQVVQEANITLQNIDAIAVGKGPGSYTGLRIGVSAAKGLCYGLDIPLIALNTLHSMAYHPALDTYRQNDTLLCPMIDARRMEVFCALLNSEGNEMQETSAVIVDENSFLVPLSQQKIIFFGDGAAKCKNTITHPNAIFLDDIHPSAAFMGKKALAKFNAQQFEDVAYFEPFYLKEFVGTVGKV